MKCINCNYEPKHGEFLASISRDKGWACPKCGQSNFWPETKQTKPTNPKDALGIKKVGLHCVPMQPLLETGLAMIEGARKYGAHNYRKDGVRFSVYFDAALRHIISWWEGEDIDPDSNVHHVIKAIACLFVVRDSMLMNNCVDDRPIRYPKSLEIEKLNEIAAELIKKYPECKEPFTEK